MKIVKLLFKVTFVMVVVFMIFYFVAYLSYNKPSEIPKTVEMDTTLPGLKLKNYIFHSEQYGDEDKKMVLVLHGGPGGDYRYLLNFKALSDSFFVVFYDQRGTGLSARTENEYLNYDTALADIQTIIKHFKPDEEVILLGHSWGGMLACGFAGTHPDMVDKMIIAEPGFLNNDMAVKYFEATNGLRPKFSARALKYLMKSYFESIHIKEPDAHASKDYFFDKLMTPGFEDHPLQGYFCNNNPRSMEIPMWRSGALASQEMMMSGFDENGQLIVDFAKNLDTLDISVLLIGSECNTIIGYEYQKEHAILFKNARLELIKDAGHFMHIEKPDKTLDLTRKFLFTAEPEP